MAESKLFRTMIVPHGHVLFMSQPTIELDGQNVFDASRRIVGVANRNTPCSLIGIAIGPAKDFDDLNPNFPFPKMGMGGVLGNDVFIRIPASWTTRDFPGVRYMSQGSTNMVKGTQTLAENPSNPYAVPKTSELIPVDATNREKAMAILRETSNKLATEMTKAQKVQRDAILVNQKLNLAPTEQEAILDQEAADSYAAAAALKAFADEAIAGTRQVAFTPSGDLAFQLLPTDTVEPVMSTDVAAGDILPVAYKDVPVRPRLQKVSRDSGATAGILGAVDWPKVAQTIAKWGGITTVVVVGTDAWRKNQETLAKLAAACVKCKEANPNNITACKEVCTDLPATITKSGEGANPVGQAGKAVSDITGAITTLAVVGVGAYALFLLMGAMSKVPKPASS